MTSFFADVAKIERRVVPVELGQVPGEFGQTVVDVRLVSFGVLLQFGIQTVSNGVFLESHHSGRSQRQPCIYREIK